METWSDMLRAEGHAAVILSQIKEKFGPVDAAVTHKIRSAGSEDLLLWAKRILTARRAEEVFNGAGH